MHNNGAHKRKQIALCSAVQHNRPYADMVFMQMSKFLPVLHIMQLLVG